MSSGNLFQDVMGNAGAVDEQLMGPKYDYAKNIKTPAEIGMSDKPSLPALGKNIDGLVSYVELLVSGKGKASMTGKPLGNKFFMKTGAKCNDVATNSLADRYIYVNNVSQGNIPFISSGLGVNFTEFRGFIPGIVEKLNVLSPSGIMQSFMSGSTPDCMGITLETIDSNNMKSSETNFVTLVDVQNMDPCNFSVGSVLGTNPLTKQKCRQTFRMMNDDNDDIRLPSDPAVQLYFASLAGLAIYMMYRMMEKSR